jgi:hypothetical protein
LSQKSAINDIIKHKDINESSIKKQTGFYNY